ncbi:hypothetical protein [Arthrobacter bambusae]|uniref:hypothetical protein n=1 Tax=Arthrobacter bambusae TaxID=1338426 RepID=UPI00277F57CE|nr:hypothetical protein [Arthrobacter bambusae]MDQ0239519.1 hypothetical protein [Arthrobacter bambusae]
MKESTNCSIPAHFTERETLFVSGAGISADAPTNGPLGVTLTCRALRHGFLQDTQDNINAGYAALGIDAQFWPRLEAVLGVLRNVHGSSELANVLADLSRAMPNDLHRFFANHLDVGGRHVTANFDMLIESRMLATPDKLVHIHGSFADAGGVDALGATLTRIEFGFSLEMRRALDRVLLDPEVKHIVFVGYSGSDYFDMTPYLRDMASSGALSGRMFTIIRHSESAPSVISPLIESPLIDALSVNGGQLLLIEGRTADILGQIASGWSFGPPCPLPREVSADLVLSELPETARAHASLELYAHMGMFEQLAKFVDGGGSWPSAHIAAEYFWARGAYRAYAQWAKSQWPDADTSSRARRAHIEANTHWIRGSYLRALRAVNRGLALEGADVDVVLRLLELKGRIFVHMRHCPDVRGLVRTRMRRELANTIKEYAAEHNESIGVHMRERARSVVTDLLPEATLGVDIRHWDASVVAFNEYESLNSVLNFQHSRLRRLVATEPQNVRLRDFVDLRSKYEVVGMVEGARRVTLLPGGGYAFPFWQTIRELAGYEVTVHHRIRLIAGFLLERTRSRSIRIARISRD